MVSEAQHVKDSAVDDIIGVRNQVSDTTILTGLWISTLIGAAVTILFCVLQRTSLLYKYRLVANHVRVKPPKLQEHGFVSLIDWAIKSISVSDVDFIQSAGLDALIMVKMCSLGVQLFLPLCFLGVTILIPLHWTGGASKKLDVSHSGFMRLTMSNIPQGSHVFWVHVVFVYLYLFWAMVLLRWHYHQYLTIRQYYLRKGDDVNVWRALYEEKDEPVPHDGGRKIGEILRSVPLIKALLPSGVPVSAESSPREKDSDDDDDDGDDLVFPLFTSGLNLLPALGDQLRRRSALSAFMPAAAHSALWSMEGPPPNRVSRESEAGDRPNGGHTSLERRSLPHAPSARVYGPVAPTSPVGLASVPSLVHHRGAVSFGPRMAAQGFDGGQGRASQIAHFHQHHHSLQQMQQQQLDNRHISFSRIPSKRLPPPPPRRLSSVAPSKQAAQTVTNGGSPRDGAVSTPRPNGFGGAMREAKGPVAEGTEGPKPRRLVDPAAADARALPSAPPPSAASAVATPTARVEGEVTSAALEPLPRPPRQQQPPAATESCSANEVQLEVETMEGRNGVVHEHGSTAVEGRTTDAEASPEGVAAPAGSSGCGGDAKERLSPPDDVAITRTNSGLDRDAHLVQWWLERREVTVPLGGKSPLEALREGLGRLLDQGIGRGDRGGSVRGDHDAAADGSAAADVDEEGRGGAGADQGSKGEVVKVEVEVDLTRPSVGHRKTVNAEYPDGTRVAVLAQLYAVLVTDVVQRKKDEGSPRGKKGAAQPEASGEPGASSDEPPTRRLGSLLPRCLRSWCNLEYGKQAARKLELNLRHTTSEEVVEQVAGSANRTANTPKTPSLASASAGAGQRLASSSDGRANLASMSHHRRTHSTQEHRQMFPVPFDASGTSGRGGLERFNSDAAATAVRGPATLGRAGNGGTGQGAGGGIGGGDKFMRLLEMMARDARAKHAVQTNSGAAGTPRCSSICHSPAVTAAELGASPRSPRSATMRMPAQLPPSRMRLETGASDVARAAASGEHAPSVPAVGRPASILSTPPAALSSSAAESGPPCDGDGAAEVAVRDARGPMAEAVEDEGQEGGLVDDRGAAVRVMVGGAGQQPLSGGVSATGTTMATDAQATVAPESAGAEADASMVGGSSLRRRRVDSSAAAAAAADTAADGDGKGAELRSQATRSSAAEVITAADRWEFVRQAVFDGRVALLPWRSRYSVVSATFLRLFPEEFDRAIPVINFKEVDLLLMRVDQHMAQYEYAVKYEEENGKQLFGRLGFCGLFGERRRLRDHHRDEINKLLERVREARLRAFDTAQTSSWFVFFRTQRAAAMASQCIIHGEDNRQFRVHPAPGPDEVNWSALWSNFRARDLRRNLMRPLVVLIVLFPIGIFTGGLMQLDYLLCPGHSCLDLEEGSTAWEQAGCTDATNKKESQQLSWGWYCNQQDFISRMLKRLVVAWLPSLLMALWQGMVLPLAFTFVVQIGREARSLSDADRCIAKNMFYFAVFNLFLGGVAGSTIVQGINAAIERGPTEIFNLIGTFVPTSSNYFINYTMFRAFVAVPLRMLWPHIGIRMYLIRRYLRFSCIITPRERAFLMAPVSPRYGFEVGMVMIVFLIGFAFSVVSPVLLPMAVLFFVISWLFWRWALLYVYVRKYEGGGTMWPFIFNRVMVCMAIFPAFTSCVLITKHAYLQAIVLLVSFPVVLIRFHTYCYYRFETGLKAMPLEASVMAPAARVEPWVYTPPPLLFNLAGWNPDWSKCWMGWNAPVVYG